MIPDAIFERVEAALPTAAEPAAKNAEPARYDTRDFFAAMSQARSLTWHDPAEHTIARLAIILDALEKADAAGSGYLLDQQMTLLMRLMRGQG